VLVPNEKGYEAARAAGAKVIAVFASASEGFSRANINCSIAESIERFKPVIARAKADGVKVRGYISCVLGCPYDGEVKPQAVVDVAKTLWDLGCYEISLGDTIGVGTPVKARQLCAPWPAPCQWPISPCIFTTLTARRWPISMPGWRKARA
jgi:Isopropylmalate/homocitrate/citramalate synthases